MTHGTLTFRELARIDGSAQAGRGHSAAAGIEISIHHSFAAVEQLWRAFEPDAECTAFQTYEWLAAWQRHVGKALNATPAIVVGRGSDGEVLFVLPLCVRNTGFVRQLEWLGAALSDYNAPLLSKTFAHRIDPSRHGAIARHILELLRRDPATRFDLVLLEKMPVEICGQPNFLISLGVAQNPSGAHHVALSGSWEDFYKSKRSSTTRRRDRTKRGKMAEFGEVRLVNAQTPAEREATLATLIEQKQVTLAAMGAPNLFARPGCRDFFHALATQTEASPLVHLSRLEVGSTIAAANLGLVHRGRYYYLLSSYGGGEVSRFGPGALHLRELMRQATEQGLTCFDFTIGDEAYKRDWCDIQLDLFDHTSAVSATGALVVARNVILRRVKRWIKQTPVLWKMFTSARSFVGSLRRS